MGTIRGGGLGGGGVETALQTDLFFSFVLLFQPTTQSQHPHSRTRGLHSHRRIRLGLSVERRGWCTPDRRSRYRYRLGPGRGARDRSRIRQTST